MSCGGGSHWCTSINNIETSQALMFLSLVVWLHSSSIAMEAATAAVCLAVAWWYNGGHKLEMITVLPWIAYLPP